MGLQRKKKKKKRGGDIGRDRISILDIIAAMIFNFSLNYIKQLFFFQISVISKKKPSNAPPGAPALAL